MLLLTHTVTACTTQTLLRHHATAHHRNILSAITTGQTWEAHMALKQAGIQLVDCPYR
jgi:DNA-binding FadR family transcriptional regulator